MTSARLAQGSEILSPRQMPTSVSDSIEAAKSAAQAGEILRDTLSLQLSNVATFHEGSRALILALEKHGRNRLFVRKSVFPIVSDLNRHAARSEVYLKSCGQMFYELLGNLVDSACAYDFSAEQLRSMKFMQRALVLCVDGEFSSTDKEHAAEGRLSDEMESRIERVLSTRTKRIILVLDGVANTSNRGGIFRAAEALGVQYVYIVPPKRHKVPSRNLAGRKVPATVSKRTEKYLTIRRFDSVNDCVKVLRAEGRVVWATHLHHDKSFPLTCGVEIPPLLAIVIDPKRTESAKNFALQQTSSAICPCTALLKV